MKDISKLIESEIKVPSARNDITQYLLDKGETVTLTYEVTEIEENQL